MTELTYARVAALPLVARTAVVALRDAGADQEHLARLVDEIHRLRDQAGHLMVDRDRQVREASRRALDCQEHGTQIRELESQVNHFSRAAERNDRGRVALLELPHALLDLRVVPTLDALRKAARKTLDAHKRAWQ